MNNNNTDLFVYTPTEVIEIFRKKLYEHDAMLKQKTYILAVRGILGNIQPTKYPVYYKVPLRDVAGNYITVDIPKVLGDITAYQQKEVIIQGFIRSQVHNNSLTFYIHATRFTPATELSEEVKEKETTLLELLSSHQRDLKPFPDLESYNITVIHGMSSDVKADFERQLSQDSSIKITYTPVSITSPDALMQAISDAECDILTVIRGGGSEEQFEVFNNFELVKAWIGKDAYKISALGHSKHRTLFDTFASYSCDTPTHAGAFIRKNIDNIKALKKIEELSSQHKKELEELLNKHKKELEDANKEFLNKLQELQKAKDAEIKTLNENASKEKDELNKKIEQLNKDFADKFQELQKAKDASIKEFTQKLQDLQKAKDETVKEFTQKIDTKETELKQLLEKLNKKDAQLKIAVILAVVAFIVMIVALVYSFL